MAPLCARLMIILLLSESDLRASFSAGVMFFSLRGRYLGVK